MKKNTIQSVQAFLVSIVIFGLLTVINIDLAAAKSERINTRNISTCKELLKSEVFKQIPKSIRGQSIEVNPWFLSQRVASKYKESAAWVKKLIPENQVVELLANFEFGLFMEHLEATLIRLALADRPKNEEAAKEVLLSVLQKLPLNAVEKKIGRGEILEKTIEGDFDLLTALGFRTLAQMRNLLYGSNLEKPSKNSLVGYYTIKTEAQFRMNKFAKAPNGPRGEARLALALSAESFELYNELFSLPEFFYHVHSPNQGTLHIGHRGLYGSYAKVESAMRAPGAGALLPMVVLSSSEGSRLTNYLNLNKIKEIPRDEKDIPKPDKNGNVNDDYNYVNGSSAAQEPWMLDGYCATGGYDSCTHWIGNMPIGDKYVDSYTFPGNVDDYAGNAKSKSPQTQKLKEYKHVHPFTHVVWQVPGHEQFADLLGLHRSNIRGELANPGWVLHTLIGVASPSRVPIVFIAVDDHKAELPEQILELSNAY
jgi:hypothetical protein